MAYSELIKSFEKIRDYIREFYIYGFRSRVQIGDKSARSYDNERRRIESWLGEFVSFRQESDGKRISLSIDSRNIPNNPLYKAYKTKSFTANDIMLHFYLMDMLSVDEGLTLTDIFDSVADDYIYCFDSDMPDESSIRKKLKEYSEEGIVVVRKENRENYYYKAGDIIDYSLYEDAITFYSENLPLGVIGSFILDKFTYSGHPVNNRIFRFKEHFMLYALDEELLLTSLLAIQERKSVSVLTKAGNKPQTVVPLKVYISTQNGRRYLIVYDNDCDGISHYRFDKIKLISVENDCDNYDYCIEKYNSVKNHIFGISYKPSYELEHIEFTIYVEDYEEFVAQRLMREKRCGRVERIDNNTLTFKADVYDALEMLPWIRTFIGKITSFNCSNSSVTERFNGDLLKTYNMYITE